MARRLRCAFRSRPGAAFLIALGSTAASVAAQVPEAQDAPDAEEAEEASIIADPPLLEREQLTGSWGGARERLAEAGISVDPYVIADWSRVTSGGLSTGSAFRHLLSINLTLDLTVLAGWESGTIFVDFHNQNGDIASDRVGDYQYVGNYDADGLTQISEAWLEFEIPAADLRLKVGKIDTNWEFATSELGWEFVHGSAGYPATAYVLPTYPDPSTGAAVFWSPDDQTDISAGIFDGAFQEGIRTGSRGPSTLLDAPADLFLIAQYTRYWSVGERDLPGLLGLGAWHHTGSFERFDGGTESGTTGFYAVFDQLLWRENPVGDEDLEFYDQGIGMYVQYDRSDAAINCIDHHVGTGLTWRGMIAGRDDDLVGVGASWVHFSDSEDAGFVDDAETAFETFYKAWITPSTTLQPYVQYIVDPGGTGIDDAINIGLRGTVQF